MCELSKTDPRFEKYPRLPVLACVGFEAREDAVAPPDTDPVQGPDS
jgi:hypothetical protein